jgi:phosphoesterase RecJ-like protein
MSPLFSRIETAEHIVLIAHRDPDADSLGSASAMYSHVLRLQKRVTLFCATEEIDRRLVYLPWFDRISRRFPETADLAIAFDCGSPGRLGVEVGCDLVNVDHHSGNIGYGTLQEIDPSAISTTQVLYDLFNAEQVRINPKMATALYAGLLDDSAAFTAHKTDRRAFEMAADLAGKGADVGACSRHLLQTVSLAATRLKGAMLQGVELLRDGTVAYLHVSRELLESTGAHPLDCEVPLEESLFLPTVRTAILLREKRDGSLKASLRSKGDGDMAAVAKQFGGGGHARASGFETAGMTPETLLEQILKLLDKETH